MKMYFVTNILVCGMGLQNRWGFFKRLGLSSLHRASRRVDGHATVLGGGDQNARLCPIGAVFSPKVLADDSLPGAPC